jgi:hypothetical protein
VIAATSAEAEAIAVSTAALGRVIPVTLRTYWSAAASISSGVAGGSSPRSSVMFRHMQAAYLARAGIAGSRSIRQNLRSSYKPERCSEISGEGRP